MSKFIQIENIENSQWIYLQHLEELLVRITVLELEMDRMILEIQTNLVMLEDEYSDIENWYSE